jgi:hypothetical protein
MADFVNPYKVVGQKSAFSELKSKRINFFQKDQRLT